MSTLNRKQLKYAGDIYDILIMSGCSTEDAIRVLDAMPNADPVNAEHGCWIEELSLDGYTQKHSRTTKRCSACDWTNACRYRYCPNCGTRMNID